MKKLFPTLLCCVLLMAFTTKSSFGQITLAERVKKLEEDLNQLEKIINPQQLAAIRGGINELKIVLNSNKELGEANQQKLGALEKQLQNQFSAFIQEIENKQRIDSLHLQNVINGVSKKIENIEKKTGSGDIDYISRLWILIAAAFVFLMQAGFKVFEFGLVRKVHGDGIGMKNLVDWLVVCIVFYVLGFGIMFGYSGSTLNSFGTHLYLPSAEEMIPNSINNIFGNQLRYASFGFEFFLFQLAFAATAATIVSGAMSERTAFIPYILTACFVGLIVYPVFGHWAWGDVYVLDNYAWLKELGFKDFAGSTVVHSIGAWVALIGIWKLGPRIGRFYSDGRVNTEDFKSYSLGYSVLGVFILWFGWWGFNGGSALKLFDSLGFDHPEKIDVASIILNTNIAAAFAGMTAFFHSYVLDKKHVYVKLLGGVLGGLVAITACCDVVTSEVSMCIGILAGLTHNYGFDLMLKMKLDDPVGAIPVHGFCGVLGTLCVSLGQSKYFTDISRIGQFGIQFLGIVVAFIFAAVLSWIFFSLLLRFTNIRVSPKEEKYGYLVGEED